MYQPYPSDVRQDGIIDFCRTIARIRKDDVEDFTNLPNRFMSGRKVGKIPATSSDIDPTDRVGDFSIALNGAFLYIVVDNTGAAEWRRVALGTF